MEYELKKQCCVSSLAMQVFYQIILVKREHSWRKKLLTYKLIYVITVPLDLGEICGGMRILLRVAGGYGYEWISHLTLENLDGWTDG